MRKLMAVALATGLIMAMAGAANAGKPTTVWTDGKGDAGNQDSSVPGFAEAGFDLVSGSIAKDGANLDFTVTQDQMPPTNQPGEAFRFLWAFSVDGTSYRLSIKSVDVGEPDVIGGTGNERAGQVYPSGEFRLEGDCSQTSAGINFVNCKSLAYETGKFDPTTKSFTAVVPMKDVKAKVGSVVTAGSGDSTGICQVCWVSHVAERSLNYTIIDSAGVGTAYKVPKK